jgi:integrase
MHRILKQALRQAVRWQILTRNPADAVDPPKVERKAMQTYDMGQTGELIDKVRETPLLAPVILAVLGGLRRGEIIALRWRHVDFTGRQLAVTESAEQTAAGVRLKETKSGRSRTVALSQSMADELQAHKVRQARELLALGVRQTGETFIVVQFDGKPIQPQTLTHMWMQFVVDSGLPRIRFHDLRHAHATHLLMAGVHPKIASERLGHSKIGITLDLYSHVMPGMQEDAAAKVDAALIAARKPR